MAASRPGLSLARRGVRFSVSRRLRVSIERAGAKPATPNMAAGRPSIYSQELADALCERIVEGETLREICGSDGMPSWSTVWRWLQANESFRAQYARAREDAAEMHADRALQEALLADDSEASRVQGARLRWDALRWHASKCAPKKYGDKQSVDITGTIGLRETFASLNAAHGEADS